jgi:protein O-GlcNAc transferase
MNAHPDDLAVALRNARELAGRGQLREAESLCEEILRRHPGDSQALLLQGVIELQTGRARAAAASIAAALQRDRSQAVAHALLGDALLELNEPRAALESYEAALRLDPKLEALHFGRANALLDLRRAGEALAGYDQFLRGEPRHAEAWFSRGNALLELRRHDLAVDSYDRAIQARPAYAAAFNNRGSALLSLQRPEQALASFQAAASIDPRCAEAFNHSGSALRVLRRAAEALQAIDRAIELRADFAEAHCNRGHALRDLRCAHEALVSYDRAIELRPDLAAAACGRGDALLDLCRPAQALAAHEQAIRLRPDDADAHNSRGNSLRSLGRSAEALACYEEALRLDPNHAVAHFNRGALLMEFDRRSGEALGSLDRALQCKSNLAPALRMRGDLLLALGRPESAAAAFADLLGVDADFDYAAGALLHAKQQCADWSITIPSAGRERVELGVLDGKRIDSPFSFLAVSDCTAAQRQCARTYVADRCASIAPLGSNGRFRHERIRLGYLSADFRAHAVSYLLAGVFELHDRERFETIAISLRPEEASPTGQRVKAAFGTFVDVSGQTDLQAAQLMRTMEIDIAVDLTGFTHGCRPRLLAYRPAPIQVNYLGFPGTAGAPYMDYILADAFVIPPDRQSLYDEQVVYLPDCFQPNDAGRAVSGWSPTRAESGLPEHAFVFCCFNNTYKINAALFDVWMRILDRAPASVLWLLGATDPIRANLRREALTRAVDPQRLVFATRRPYAEHLARLRLADLFLDTMPFNGGTTVSDALWAGVPVLTRVGEALAARMAGSLLRTVGLPELIAQTTAQYESMAVDFARRPPMLQRLRERLNEQGRGSALFDTSRMRRHLESAYEQMWLRHAQGEQPASFAVGCR